MSPKRLFTILGVLICVVFVVVQGQEQQTYVLGPGDVLEVKVFGQPELNSTPQVDSDGNLSSLHFIDSIPAKCRTEKQVQKDIALAYSRLIKDPQVSVRILERKSRQPASVSGAVRTAGKVPTERKIRLNELIAASGGITEKAAGTIQILHTEPVLCPGPGEEAASSLPVAGTAVPLEIVKISDLQAGTVNPVIRSGDLVLVTEAVPVYITGSVVAPGSVMANDQLTLSKALSIVGGTRREAKLSEIRIYRQKGNEQEVLKVNFEAIKKSETPDIFLKPYDVIEVSENGFFGDGNWWKVLAGIFLRGAPLPVPYE